MFPGFARIPTGHGAIIIHTDDDAYRGHPWFDALRREGAARGIGAEVRLRVDDVEAAYEAALRAGAQSIQAPAIVDDAVAGTVMGPDGFLFTFSAV